MIVRAELSSCKATLIGVIRLTGFQDSVDLVEKFSHNGDDDLLGFFPAFLESIAECFE